MELGKKSKEVENILKGKKYPFKIMKMGIYKIGEKKEIKNYFERNYICIENDIKLHDKFKGKKGFKIEISPELISENKKWKKEWISHYSSFFITPHGLCFLIRVYNKAEKRNEFKKIEPILKKLKIKKSDLLPLKDISKRSLYLKLNKIASQEKNNWNLSSDRITFWGKRKKPLFHLQKIINKLKDLQKKKLNKKEKLKKLTKMYKKKGSKNPEAAARKYLSRHPEELNI